MHLVQAEDWLQSFHYFQSTRWQLKTRNGHLSHRVHGGSGDLDDCSFIMALGLGIRAQARNEHMLTEHKCSEDGSAPVGHRCVCRYYRRGSSGALLVGLGPRARRALLCSFAD